MRSFRKKDRLPNGRRQRCYTGEESRRRKINLLMERMPNDRDWLEGLTTNRLNAVFLANFHVDDEDEMPRSCGGQFAVEGGTEHQVRKMQKMGIAARQVEV